METTKRFLPVAREGWPFIIPGIVIFFICLLMCNAFLSILFGIVTLSVALFFRDPNRKTLQDEHIILSPADGRILEIPQTKKTENGTTPTQQISIFMSVLNCHINRIPLSGRVTKSEYNPGKFLPAFREKASLLNEQNTIYISKGNMEVGIRQIAGLIARRIVCRAMPGNHVKQGDRFGLIRFGSRVDVLLPPNVEILAKPGQKVKAGLSIIARIKK
ncbi:phosphatidylserine decarboxylase family protein [bacterium]|nr:phosphatidylserine decarboxylase family protein [bacterium]